MRMVQTVIQKREKPMIIKPFAHGKSRGCSPIDYLLREDYPGRDENPPEVVRGDTELTRELIDNNNRKWKFTSGVCSWSPDDNVDTNQEDEVMTNFEKLAFAGLEHDQYNILWVRHSHANHHELHFIIPRLELSTGKAFNAFPPGWEKDFCHLRDYENIKHNWTRPDDPDRARMFTPSKADIIEARLTRWGQNPTKQEKEQARNIINEYLKDQIENGLIKDRSDIITSLREIGLDINRESKTYITVKDPESPQKIRLKGGIYNADWNTTKLSRETKTEGQGRTPEDRRDIQRQLTDIKQELTRVINKRATYNRKRYPTPSRTSDLELKPPLQNPEHSPRQTLDTLNPYRSSNSARTDHSLMGTTPNPNILDKHKDQQTGLDTDRNKGTRADSIPPEERHLRNLPQDKRERQIHSPTKKHQDRNQLDLWRQRFNTSNRHSLTPKDKLSISDSNPKPTNIGKPKNENKRTRENCTKDHHLNRKGHGGLEGVRKPKNLHLRETILKHFGTIRELGRLTNEIKNSYKRIKSNINSPQKPLTKKQQHKSHGVER